MFERVVFSARLKELIQQRNMTYAQLAGILGGVHRTMANGKAGTSLERLYLLCQTFEISADYLLGLTDDLRPLR